MVGACIFLQNWALSLSASTTFWTKLISSGTFDFFFTFKHLIVVKRYTTKCHNALVIGLVSKCIILPGIRGKIKQGVSIQKVCTNISKFDLWKYFPKFFTCCDEKIIFGMFLFILHLISCFQYGFFLILLNFPIV